MDNLTVKFIHTNNIINKMYKKTVVHLHTHNVFMINNIKHNKKY